MLLGFNNIGIGSVINQIATKGGHGWVTADAGAALFDGVPGRRTRIRWMSGSLTKYDHIRIQCWPTLTTPVNFVGLLNVNLPLGSRISFDLWSWESLAYAVEQRVSSLGNGQRGVIISFPRGPVITKVDILLFTDVNDSADIPAESVWELGELVLADMVELEHQRDWKLELIDPSTLSRTRGSRLVTNPRVPYRTFSADLAAQPKAVARGGALLNGSDWQSIQRRLVANERVVAIPRHRLESGAPDLAEMQRTAIFGIGRMSTISHAGGDWYETAISIDEIP